jgi:hypothetical protein
MATCVGSALMGVKFVIMEQYAIPVSMVTINQNLSVFHVMQLVSNVMNYNASHVMRVIFSAMIFAHSVWMDARCALTTVHARRIFALTLTIMMIVSCCASLVLMIAYGVKMMDVSCVKLVILLAMLVIVVNHVSSNAYTAIQLPSVIFVLVVTLSKMVDAGLVLLTVKSA